MASIKLVLKDKLKKSIKILQQKLKTLSVEFSQMKIEIICSIEKKSTN